MNLTARVTSLEKKVSEGFAGVDQRFEKVDKRFESLENKMDARFAAVDKRFDDFEKRIDQRFIDFENRIDKKFDDFLIKMIQHFPSRIEVEQMIENSPRINAIQADVNELKDQVADLRDDLEVRDAFTQHRLTRIETHLGFEPIGLPV